MYHRFLIKILNLLDNNNRCINKNELTTVLGAPVTQHNYDLIQRSINDSLYLAEKNRVSTGAQSLSLDNFITRFKKGSKPFRKVLSVDRESKIKCRSRPCIKTFFRLINIAIPEDSFLKHLHSQWGYNILPNKMREFIYKFRNNILGLNTRVAHFNANINRGCTFCTNSRLVPVPDETFVHLFFDCPITKTTIDRFCDSYLPELDMRTDNKKKEFFFYGNKPIE
jgi:hypothetical protein